VSRLGRFYSTEDLSIVVLYFSVLLLSPCRFRAAFPFRNWTLTNSPLNTNKVYYSNIFISFLLLLFEY
jgi:hypothetical protein